MAPGAGAMEAGAGPRAAGKGEGMVLAAGARTPVKAARHLQSAKDAVHSFERMHSSQKKPGYASTPVGWQKTTRRTESPGVAPR